MSVGDIAGFARWCADRVAQYKGHRTNARLAADAAAEAASASDVKTAILAAKAAARLAAVVVYEEAYDRFETSGEFDSPVRAARFLQDAECSLQRERLRRLQNDAR
jgi:hypothetical protein